MDQTMQHGPLPHTPTIRLMVSVGLVAVLLSACASTTTDRTPATGPQDAAITRVRTPGVDPATAAVQRGQRYRQSGNDEAALASFERAIEINPQLAIGYIGAAEIYRERGDYPAAEQRYATAARVEPRNFSAQYGHGLTLQLLGRLAESVRAYLRALAIRPQDFNANLNLATAYLQLGEPKQARVYAIRAVRLKGDSGPARANLGAVYAALGEYQAAVAEYQQAAELMELTPQLLLNLADALSRTSRHPEAINTLEQVLRLEPTPIAYERLGAARFRMRSYDEAQEAFEAALELDPDHYPALNGLGVCYLNKYLWSKRTDTTAQQEAMRLLRRSLQIQQNQPRIIELVRRYD